MKIDSPLRKSVWALAIVAVGVLLLFFLGGVGCSGGSRSQEDPTLVPAIDDARLTELRAQENESNKQLRGAAEAESSVELRENPVAAGQVQVLEAESLEPIAGAKVELFDSEGAPIDVLYSSADGWCRLAREGWLRSRGARVGAPERALAVKRWIPSDDTVLVQVMLEQDCCISGQVEAANPADFTVFAFTESCSGCFDPRSQHLVGSKVDGRFVTAKVDSSGAFTLEGLLPDDRCSVGCVGPGAIDPWLRYASCGDNVNFRPQYIYAAEVHLRTVDGGRVRGQSIYDPFGTPTWTEIGGAADLKPVTRGLSGLAVAGLGPNVERYLDGGKRDELFFAYVSDQDLGNSIDKIVVSYELLGYEAVDVEVHLQRVNPAKNIEPLIARVEASPVQWAKRTIRLLPPDDFYPQYANNLPLTRHFGMIEIRSSEGDFIYLPEVDGRFEFSVELPFGEDWLRFVSGIGGYAYPPRGEEGVYVAVSSEQDPSVVDFDLRDMPWAIAERERGSGGPATMELRSPGGFSNDYTWDRGPYVLSGLLPGAYEARWVSRPFQAYGEPFYFEAHEASSNNPIALLLGDA